MRKLVNIIKSISYEKARDGSLAFFVSIAVMLSSCVREIHLEPESSFQAHVRHIPRPGGIKLGSPVPKFAAN